MSIFDNFSSYAKSTIKNTVGDFALDKVNEVFSNVPYLSDLGFRVNDNSIFDTSLHPINDLDKYAGDFSFSNRFDFVFILPTMLRKEVPNIEDILRVFCRQFPIPSSSTNVTKHKILNRTITGVNSIDFDTINATFFDTKRLSLHKLFTIWNLGKWNDRGMMKFYPNDYKTDVLVTNYDEKVYILRGLHPVTIGDAVLSHDSTDEFMSFDVTFSVDSIEPVGEMSVNSSESSLSINTGLDIVDDIANFGLKTLENYFGNEINQLVSNASRSITSKLRF